MTVTATDNQDDNQLKHIFQHIHNMYLIYSKKTLEYLILTIRWFYFMEKTVSK